MSTSKALAAATRTKQYANLLSLGLQDVTTERQAANGSIAFTGKFRAGRRTIRPSYVVTANGAVISNEFVARKVSNYRQGFQAVAEILKKRLGA